MCGVMGYVGKSASAKFFLQGLKRLEYRGYDSSGIAMLAEDDIHIQRAEGKLCNLEEKLSMLPQTTTVGIGHTRWATHGKPTENNAHPHRSGPIALLHNGIIENFKVLKDQLQNEGYVFSSETDTEVAVHLIHKAYESKSHIDSIADRMEAAIKEATTKIEGAYAFAIICKDLPDALFAVKQGSPIVLGQGKGENYLASGITALLDHTDSVSFLEDGDFAILSPENIEIHDLNGNKVQRPFKKIEWSSQLIEKNGFRHFMLKEIHEHPQAVSNALSNSICRSSYSIDLQAYGILGLDFSSINKIHIIACGSSYYASLLSKSYIERFAKIPVEVDLASEYRYRYCTANEKTLVIAVSQSGETADTLQATKYAKQNNAKSLAIVNMPGSSLGSLCDFESQILAGPEIGVASTKAFSAQMASLVLLGLAFAQENKTLSSNELKNYVDDLIKVPTLMEKSLGISDSIEKMAHALSQQKNMLFIGRGPQYPIALESALKLKEISYIHAEGYAAGELKHGPIALIDEEMVVVCIAPKDEFYEKTMSNIHEIKARGGKILGVGHDNDEHLKATSDYFIAIPASSSFIAPFMTVVPMHLFAYWIAVRKGTDVDQPRNLAKSVTVE
jgi:glucosamine--fructose-6-phosphate aminotransferase (isomerizing)